jgi:signal recognition particle subunit SRP54
MLPGMPQGFMEGADEEQTSEMFKRLMIVTDSMTAEELDSDGSIFFVMNKEGKPIEYSWRLERVARGSGASLMEIEQLLQGYKMMANMAKGFGGKNGL